MTREITFTRRLAPEDIVPGLYIAIAARTHEIVPLWLMGSVPGEVPEPIRISCKECGDGEPRRVLATCLPFVLTENARGYTETLDIRLCVLVQVDEMYALELFTRPDPDRNCD